MKTEIEQNLFVKKIEKFRNFPLKNNNNHQKNQKASHSSIYYSESTQRLYL